MTLKSLFKTNICFSILSGLILQGCTQTNVAARGEISSLQADTTIALKVGSENSPTCHVTVDYMYLQPSAEKDSLSKQINQTLQRVTFGTDYIKLSPSEAILQLQQQYATTYRKELLSYYEADVKSGMGKEDLPPWYNHEYSISSELTLSRDSIYNYSVTNYQFTGGAHPNTFSNWTNINAHTGKELKKSDVFTEGSDKQIIQLIGRHLLADVNKRLETDTITSLQGLWDNGILLNIDLYVPDNFLITDEGVKFLYNRYDIAPYVMGDFQLNIPYAEIENLMKIK